MSFIDQIRCSGCRKHVAGIDGGELIIRAYIECPECIEKTQDMCDLKTRVIESMEWMLTDIKWRDEQNQNLEEGSQPKRSPKLQTAIDLLKELQS